jgi:hypothetical protein
MPTTPPRKEAGGYFAEFRPFVPLCAYQVSASRYTSYLGLFHGEGG